ncbi:hypothetical protein X471_00301 [Bartonella bacilliformis str. Heidi Mejia]|uniref:SPOR domain-containing protein n=1 Tax=Bartonella bacilliformis TaxID=774 RepID=UPI0004538FD1|nr:SPOR domain-containing protein [Bartonella bacilliformis]EYS92017.1 hypothetical protein X471_00301 [Bartonella bacilliformis str. Heidi Mejia]KEG18911.1 hypothetical protein H707_00646 [Bartonella bacilliformis Hosp800-02]KEG23423.1 hypothetical protein H708_00654 [Bartonella bacilliformis VAB9028]KEG24368.1 hypothetical protein H706_00656 [Bartonella bacilliformis CAR600-02]
MREKDHKYQQEEKQDHEHYDPLERFTQFLNRKNENQGSQHTQASSQSDHLIPQSPKTHFQNDDFDLPFLDEEFANNLTDQFSFDEKDEPADLPFHVNNQETANTPSSTVSSVSPEENDFLSEIMHSSSLNKAEEKILNTLSPLPIQKNQILRNKQTATHIDPFFAEDHFNEKLEDFPLNADINDRTSTTKTAHKNAVPFSQTKANHSDIIGTQSAPYNSENSYYKPSNSSHGMPTDQQTLEKDQYSGIQRSSSSSSLKTTQNRDDASMSNITSAVSSFLNSPQTNKPLDLEDLSQEEHIIDYPKSHKREPLQQEVDIKKAQYNQDNLNYMSLKTTQKGNSFAHNSTHHNNPPPDVDTYKFIEEIVEKTEPVMVSEIPYEKPKEDRPTDGLKKEFSDVFNVGNISENDFSQKQSKFFNELFHTPEKNPKADLHINTQQKNANYHLFEKKGYSSSFPENLQYRFTNEKSAHKLTTPIWKNFIISKGLIGSAVFLIAIVIAFINYLHFFMSSNESENSPIIHSDNVPFKVKPETTDTENNIIHNLNIYNQITERDEKKENTQKFLIDASEQPELLTELNELASANTASSSPEMYDNVEDTITEALNHTMPTQEVQTVIVKPDGTRALTSINNENVEDPNHATPTQEVQTVIVRPDGTRSLTSNRYVQKTTVYQPEVVEKSQVTSEISSHSSDISEQESYSKENIDTIIAGNTSTHNIMGKSDALFIPVPSLTKPSLHAQTQVVSRSNPSTQTTAQNLGNYYVQLASQPTLKLAEDSLRNLKSKFRSLIGTHVLNIYPTSIPEKGLYYRVRIQTQNRDEAISLCEDIKSSGGSCFITAK